ncbi:FkbM family methyltransferase [Sulfurimonas sp.]
MNSIPFNQLVATKYGLMLVNKNDYFIGQSLILYGEISEEENDIYRNVCEAGDTVVEVGANIGAHSLPISKFIGKNGKLFCYEPQRIIFQTLNANLALNSITNATTFQAGLGTKNDHMVVPEIDYSAEGNFGGVSIQNNDEGEYTNIYTLDSHLKFTDLKLLKIDVEGMEIDVLKGAIETIKQHQPFIYCENDRKENSEELIRLLWSLNYKVYHHVPKLFNKNNFNNNEENIFGDVVSLNIICVPEHKILKNFDTLNLQEIG